MQPKSERVLIVVNHHAARARRAWPHIKNALASSGVAFEAYESGAVGEAEQRVRLALREGYETIASVGGDGTLSEVARGFFEPPASQTSAGGDYDGDYDVPRQVNPSASLAVLPAGTGDDFARGLSLKRAPLESWLARLVGYCRAPKEARLTRTVDAIDASVDDGARRFVCLNAATVGFSAEVVTRVSEQAGAWRRLRGEARFALAAFGALAAWRNRDVRVLVDDDYTLECATNLIAVANGAYAGGGMNFAPPARTDDGRLDLLIARSISRAGVVRELARIHRGGHINNPDILLKTATRVRVETIDAATPLPVEADGDMRGHTPARFRVMPSALRVVWS